VSEETTSKASSQAAPFNPDEPASVAAAAPSLTFTRAPDFKTIFSDIVRPTIGNGSITIVFSKLTHKPSLNVQTNIVEEHVEVVMTWTQFKMVMQNFSSILSAIETEVGPIPMPHAFRASDASNRAIVRALGLTASPTSDAPTRAESD
jgi:hypothetical protein